MLQTRCLLQDGSRTDVSDAPPPRQTPLPCAVGALALGPASVFAILAYFYVFLLPLDLEILGASRYPRVGHRPQYGGWMEVYLTYQLRITLLMSQKLRKTWLSSTAYKRESLINFF